MKLAVTGLSLLLFTCVLIQGEPRVICSSQPIVAVVGDDIILPCHLEPPANVEVLTLEWSRLDFKPDPKDLLNRKYVHIHRDGREVDAIKNPSYYGRTALFEDTLKYGNISLKLTNVTFSDEGRYRCFIPKLRSSVKESVIQLIVAPSPSPQSPVSSNTTQKQWPPRHPDRGGGTEDEGDSSISNRVLLSIGICSGGVVLLSGAILYFLRKRPRKRHDKDQSSRTERSYVEPQTSLKHEAHCLNIL